MKSMNTSVWKFLMGPHWLALWALILVGCDGEEPKDQAASGGTDTVVAVDPAGTEQTATEATRNGWRLSKRDASEVTDEPSPPAREKAPDKPEPVIPRLERSVQEPAEMALDDDAEIEAEALRYRQAMDPEDRAEALEEIGSIDSDSMNAVNVFREALNDPHPEVRIEAVRQLADSETREAWDGLVYALNDTDSEVVLEAIEGLSFLDDPSYIKDLTALMSHPNTDIQEAAQEAIEFLEE